MQVKLFTSFSRPRLLQCFIHYSDSLKSIYKLLCSQGLLLHAIFIISLVVTGVVFQPIPLGETQIWSHVAQGLSSQCFNYLEVTSIKDSLQSQSNHYSYFPVLCDWLNKRCSQFERLSQVGCTKILVVYMQRKGTVFHFLSFCLCPKNIPERSHLEIHMLAINMF